MTPGGLFEFNVMPFGSVNAPMVFQEIPFRKLEHQRNSICNVDEVIISSVDEGTVILNELLQAVGETGLALSKYTFMQTRVKFTQRVKIT